MIGPKREQEKTRTQDDAIESLAKSLGYSQPEAGTWEVWEIDPIAFAHTRFEDWGRK